MAKQIKDSERIMVGTGTDSNNEKVFFVHHKDVMVKGRCIVVYNDHIGEFMSKLHEKIMFCRQKKCKLNLTTWEQVMAQRHRKWKTYNATNVNGHTIKQI